MQSDFLSSSEEKISPKLSLLSPFLVYFLTYFLFLIPAVSSIISYSIVYISSSLIFILLCFYIIKNNFPKNYIYFLLVCSILLRISLLFIYPTGSDDYYRYLWDGKVIANGINPYQYAPEDKELSGLHSESLPALVKFPEVKTIYPPLSLSLFFIGYLIGGESFWGIKVLLLLFDLLTLWGIFLILKELKFPPKNILIYALAPLPLFQFFIDSHVDGFGLPLFLFSIYFYLKKKTSLSLVFAGLSVCIKPLSLLLFPILFFIEKGAKAKAKIIILPLLICSLIYLPFVFTANVLEALTSFTVNWTFNGFIFETLNSFIKDNQDTRLVCGILFLLSFVLIIFFRKNFLNKIYFSILLLFIFSPIVHPWYVAWLAVLLPFIPKWSGILYTCLVSLTAFTILNYHLNGIWKSYPAVLVIEYVPVLIFLFYEFSFNKKEN